MSLLGKCCVLIAASAFCLALSYTIHFLTHGELLIDSPVGLIGSIICPYIVMVIGTEGHVVCDASEQRPNQLIEIWLVLSSYLLLMAGALYLGILPASPGLFVMPLVSIVFILLFVLWQRRRIHRRNDKPVIRD